MAKIQYKCLSPYDAWDIGYTHCKDGVWSPKLTFSRAVAIKYYSKLYGFSSLSPEPVQLVLDKHYIAVDCGKCLSCQLRKRQDMTVRLQHERSMVQDCCFITLTYNDASMPETWPSSWKDGDRQIIGRGLFFGVPTLLPSDAQKFIKRLRRHLEYVPTNPLKRRCRDHVSSPIRYFCVGEYGAKRGRPHYHILIFGWKPSDLVLHENRKGYCVYRSSQIEKLWTHGFSTVGDVNGGVAKYCARYVTKKFARINDANVDEIEKYRCPEFVLQSVRNGGIGAPWLEKYRQNLVHGYVSTRSEDGVVYHHRVPRYYYDRLRKVDLPLWLDLRDERIDFVRLQRNKTVPDAYDGFGDLVRRCKCFGYQVQNEKHKELDL